MPTVGIGPEPGTKLEIDASTIMDVQSTINFHKGYAEVTVTFHDTDNEFIKAFHDAMDRRTKRNVVKNYRKTLTS